MNTTSVENNPGAASVILLSNRDKDLEVVCSVVMAEKDVEKNPLKITDAKFHQCYLDEDKKIANREYKGKMHEADFYKMKEQRKTRFKQNRPVQIVSEKDSEEMTH